MNLILLIESLSMESNEHPEKVLKQVIMCFDEYRFAVDRYNRRNPIQNESIPLNVDREQWKQLKEIINEIAVSS